MRRFALYWLLAVLLAVPTRLPAKAPKPYNPKPFLKGLSKPYRKKTARKLGVRRLSDLTLYKIDLDLNAALGTLNAHQEIIFKNRTKQTLSDLVLRIFANDRKLCQGDERNLQIVDVNVEGEQAEFKLEDPTVLRITLAKTIKPGGWARVGLDYHAEIPLLGEKVVQPGEGLQDAFKQVQDAYSRTTYGIYARSGGIINLGFFYPIIAGWHARDWDIEDPVALEDLPHFDVANYLINLKVSRNTVVASSGIAVKERVKGQVKKIRLVGTAMRTFALQLFSSRYRAINRDVGGTRVRVFHLAEHRTPAAKILTHTANALLTYKKLFGPYPYPELDVAQAPLFGGAIGVEHPGLILVAAALPGGDPATDKIARIFTGTATQEIVLAHLVAHQWWHALVGSDSLRYPFLDEALARYAVFLLLEKRHGPKAADHQLRLTLKLPYQIHRAQGGSDQRVLLPSEDFDSRLEYTALVQSKGALFFHALRETLGKKPFSRFLRRYATRFAFRKASPEDLLKIATRVAGRRKKDQVEELYRRWLAETHGDEDIGLLEPDKLVKLLEQLKELQKSSALKPGAPIESALIQLLE